MPLAKKLAVIVPLLFVLYSPRAQRFGGNPPSIRWQQVNTPDARVIFPPGLDSQATRVANIISFLADADSTEQRRQKIDLVLQNQTTISNGYVGLGPFRSEFFLTPLQNSFALGSLPWADQLAIHEFRHVQQYNAFNVGLSRVLRIVFGQEGQALANNAAIPGWFFEGDAVYNETHVSRQGRGRLPFFYNDYRSLWQANRKYAWMKLRNGSYRDFVPDHYALGYLLVAYGREKYGEMIWKKITHDAAAFKGLFYPFQQAVKRYTGKDFVTFRNEALQYFKTRLHDEMKDTVINGRGDFTNYEYPAYTENNGMVFVKSGFKNVPAFYITANNRERRIRTKDVSLDNYFSYRNGRIVYASYRPDRRWGYRDYGELQILDIASGRQRRLTRNTKYFSPDISGDGKRIVAVQVDTRGRSSLHIIDAENGTILSALPNQEREWYTYPKFYGADTIISAVRDKSGQMTMAQTDIRTGITEYLFPFSFAVMGFPNLWRDTLYFSASLDEEDKLFAYSLKDKILLTPEPSAAGEGSGYYQPSVQGDAIVWTNFTANGFKLVKANKTLLHWRVADSNYFTRRLSDFGVTAMNSGKSNTLASIPYKQEVPLRYPKATGLLNFHSIQPYISDPEYSITWVSENILNTLQSQVSFTYHRNEGFKRIGFSGIYGALFPYISAGMDYTLDRRGRYRGQRIYWNEAEPSAGISVPLNMSRGRSFTNMNIGTRYTFNLASYKGAFKDTLGSISYSYLNNFFSFVNQDQKTRQQIYPRFAQTVALNFKTAVSHYKSAQFVADANLYFPGLLLSHSLVVNGAYLKKDKTRETNFSANFPFSRGYTSENLYEMLKWGVDYHFPLLYPDWGFASIIYLLRLRANLFYDQTRVHDFYSNGSLFKAGFASAGTEIYFDTKWWNAVPLTFGIRYSRLLDADLFGTPGRNRWDIILPVNLLQQ